MRSVLRLSIVVVAACLAATSLCAQAIVAEDAPLFSTRAQTAPALRGALPSATGEAGNRKGEAPMTFRLGRRAASGGCGLECAEFIIAEGEIQRDSATDFSILWQRLKRKDLPVVIHSHGGSLEGGLDLGRAFRQLSVTATVGRVASLSCTGGTNRCTPADQYAGVQIFADAVGPGLCNSACVYAFAGAVARYVAPDSRVGVHQFFVAREDDPRRKPKETYTRKDFGNLQRTVAEVASYLVEMGVSIDVLTHAAGVDPATIRTLTRAELADLHLTTAQLPQVSLPARATAPSPRAASPAKENPQQGFAALDRADAIVMRDGQPWLVLSAPSQSRRFGAISNEVAIGCAADSGRFTASFREVVPDRPKDRQDARVAIGTSTLEGSVGAVSRDDVLTASEKGALVVEVTSSATAGYPMRIEFPGPDLRSGLEKLRDACRR